MEMPMVGEKKRHEFGDPQVQRYLEGTDTVVLALVTPLGAPFAMPMYFAHDEQALAMVSVDGLAKLRHLERDPRVCVVAEGGERGAVNGLILSGTVRFLDGRERAEWGERFAQRYAPAMERLWGEQELPANRRVFCVQPSVRSAWGLE
ncbi:MAG: general stress protein 26 [Gammaproteobacteria bacterium]|jgi:general stress protein 26